MTKYKYKIEGIDCASCADSLAEKTNKIDGVLHAQADFMHQTLSFECEPKDKERVTDAMRTMIAREEPDVVFRETEKIKEKEEEEE